MAKSRPITKWSVLALVCAAAGAAVTLTIDQMWLSAWAKSGKHFPISQFGTVDLPAGQTLVYYESPFSVPVGDATLFITNPEGERVRPIMLADDMSYRMMLTGWSGRALWKLDITQPGPHRFRCSNHSVESDADIPAEDRVAFLKQPDSLTEVTNVRKFIQITGATATLTLVIAFYVLHGLALRSRARTAAEPVAA